MKRPSWWLRAARKTFGFALTLKRNFIITAIAKKEDEPPDLSFQQRKKLETFFQHIVSTASVEFTNEEIKDLQYAVWRMLQRITDRINKRGVFKVSRIEPTGSMVEESLTRKVEEWGKEREKGRINKRGEVDVFRIVPTGSMAEETSTWKVTKVANRVKPYLEFDYLAILEAAIKNCEDLATQNKCKGCIKIINPPVDFDRVSYQGLFTQDPLNRSNALINKTFIHEIHTCLTSSCKCLTRFSIHTNDFDKNTHMHKPSSVDKMHGCVECTVDMPTGTLSVNTETPVYNSSGSLNKILISVTKALTYIHIPVDNSSYGPNKCSLILKWTRKRNSLIAHDKFLRWKHGAVSLPIYIDFLPALESLKQRSSGDEYDDGSSSDEYEHDYFIVPKHCNVCPIDTDSEEYRWRKSWCMAEMDAVSRLSVKHRRCYQITKYLTLPAWPIRLNKYLIKNVVLQHSDNCPDTTDDCVDCVIKLYQEIVDACNTGMFVSYHSNLNIPIRNEMALRGNKAYFKTLLTELNSVSETETWNNFVYKLNQRCQLAGLKSFRDSIKFFFK